MHSNAQSMFLCSKKNNILLTPNFLMVVHIPQKYSHMV